MNALPVELAVTAIQRGQAAILPTDTVYGLCASPYHEDRARRVYRLKGRDETQPLALLTADLEMLFECVPELRGRGATVARALLPGPYTLVLPNPARRFRWLSGTRPTTIGVRVPLLPPAARAVVEAVGAVAATSANVNGDADPRRVAEISPAIAGACAVVLDAGDLPGTPSTVVDVSEGEPRILREGAVPGEAALTRIAEALRPPPRAAAPR